jgi:hypothetical protein
MRGGATEWAGGGANWAGGRDKVRVYWGGGGARRGLGLRTAITSVFFLRGRLEGGQVVGEMSGFY